jgi:NAD(P)-dependent dehydrogenase (short-subunit alcohol dehydrogenase family)
MQLENKTCIITGGSRGIGKAIALAFAREGANLVLASRTPAELEATRQEIISLFNSSVAATPTDVSQPEEVEKLVGSTLERFSTIDVLVNCAGIYGPISLITDIDSLKWLRAIKVNLFGTFLCIQAVLPEMMRKKRGKIINLSGGGAVTPFPRFSAYSASKAAVVRLTETLAEEVREYHIDINAIAPGSVNTRLLDQVLAAGKAAGGDFLAKSIRQKKNGGTPLEKPAELAVFLASPRSNGLTGRIISAVWDNWEYIPEQLEKIMSSDIYTMRRIVPEDRDYEC